MPASADRSRIFVSAGETSGDMYAAWLLEALKQRLPEAECFGCAGQRLREAGCEALLRAEAIAMVGLAEVLTEVPRVWRAYRDLLKQALARRPGLAILVDAPDFNLRLARHFHKQGVPVLYVVAPQVWAWRGWRVRKIRRVVDRLECIFPFEEAWFRERGVNAEYIGHPLTGRVSARLSRAEFFEQQGLDLARPLVALLPGSRQREVALNLPPMIEAASRLPAQCVVALPPGLSWERWRPAGGLSRHSQRASGDANSLHTQSEASFSTSVPLSEAGPAGGTPALPGRMCALFPGSEAGGPERPSHVGGIPVVRGLTYDAVAHADAALVASGTATIETALLGTPMVVVYRVTEPTWRVGRLLVSTRFFSMVNLVAGREVVPELIQDAFTPERAAGEIGRLLENGEARGAMKRALAEVAAKLGAVADPLGRAADRAVEMLAAGQASAAETGRKQRGSWS